MLPRDGEVCRSSCACWVWLCVRAEPTTESAPRARAVPVANQRGTIYKLAPQSLEGTQHLSPYGCIGNGLCAQGGSDADDDGGCWSLRNIISVRVIIDDNKSRHVPYTVIIIWGNFSAGLCRTTWTTWIWFGERRWSCISWQHILSCHVIASKWCLLWCCWCLQTLENEYSNIGSHFGYAMRKFRSIIK